jgi:hypothetical protein
LNLGPVVVEAAVTLNTAHDAALAQYGAAHPLTLRTQLALAQMMAAIGEYEKAQTQLQATVAGLRKLGAQGESNLALARESLGDGETHLGRIEEASVDTYGRIAISY